ncbi:TfoX/Sxy family DNA transformation protein [Marinicella meishanensis]|uniref:TfoX/Sxy family DNA transformation protein n=1 Tax=Marinicella meishanensis TaxID=2873263 RepID=UPI001CBC9786|nr:TfoX/Sxy family DNA transformation protein [Marinicella sp. NBU2979]
MNPSQLPNLGPKTEAMLAQIGIHTAAEFMARDPYVVYAELMQAGTPVGLNGLYAFLGAQQGIDWLTVAQTQKETVLMRLDDLGLAPK